MAHERTHRSEKREKGVLLYRSKAGGTKSYFLEIDLSVIFVWTQTSQKQK